MKLTLVAASLFWFALTPSAQSADRQGKAGASPGPWTVIPAQDCDNGIGALRELSVSRDGSFVAALRHDACLWRAKDGHRLKQLEFAQPVVFAGNLLFLGDKIFDPAKLAVVGTTKLPRYGTESADVFAVVGPTTAAIVTFDYKAKIQIYDWNTKVARPFPGTGHALSSKFVLGWDEYRDDGPPAVRWASIAEPTQQGSFRLSKNGRAVAVALGGDRAVFAYGHVSQDIEVWAIPEGRRLAKLPAGTPDTLGISPDGKTMATSEYIPSEGEEYWVVIWQVAPLRATARVRIKLTASPRAFRFDDTARTLVVCDDNGACVFLRRR
jgi:hypothetical protein